MPSFFYYLRWLFLLCLIGLQSACDTQDEQRTKYIEEGKRLYQAGEIKNAQQSFEQALASDPQNAQGHFEVAEALSSLGNLQEAAKQYQAAISQDASHIPARLKLGRIYLAAGKTADADKLANDVLAIEPENIDAMVLQGSILSAQNNSDAAFVKAEAAFKKKPDDAGALMLLASLNAKTGQREKAVALLQNFIEHHAAEIPARLMLASLFNQYREREKAEAVLEAVVKIEPKQWEHRKRLASYLLATEASGKAQVDKAEAVLREAVADLPDKEAAELMLVEFLAAKKAPEVAIAELLPMVEQNPKHFQLRFKLAELQLALKQPSQAETTLKETAAADKAGLAGLRAQIRLANLYLGDKRVDEAKALLKGLLESHPNDANVLALRGEMALIERRIPEAIADFRSVLAEQPNNVQVLKWLSSAHLLNKDPVLARENLEKVVALLPADETARLELIGLLLQAGEKERATQQLNALFKLNPNSKKGLEALFKISAAQKQWDKALQMAEQLKKLYPNDANGYYTAGLAYQAMGKTEQSNAELEQSLAKQAQAIEPLEQLVKNYLAAKQPDKALHKLREVLKQHPGHFYAQHLIGEVYSRSNKYPDAINAYMEASKLKPGWAVPYRNIALLHILQKQQDEAIAALSKGIASADEPMGLVADLAALYHQDGAHEKAIALYEDMHQKYPNSLPVLNNLASYLADYGTAPEALARAAKLAESLAQSNDPYMLDTLAWVAYKQGQYEKARDVLVKVLAMNPGYAQSQFHLGMVYFKLGDKPHAQENLQNAVASKEEFNGLAEAKKTLETLGNNAKNTP